MILETRSCESDDKTKPYCSQDKKMCVDDKNACTNEISFTCKYRGFFPHPLECNKFFYCDEKNLKADVYTCPEKSQYDPLKSICGPVTTTCVNFSDKGLCSKKNGSYVTHPADASVYVFCPVNGGIPDKLETCDSKDMKMLRYRCVYNCKQEGFFKDPTADTKYVTCTKEGTNYVANIQECQNGKIFNENSFCTKTSVPDPTTTPAMWNLL